MDKAHAFALAVAIGAAASLPLPASAATRDLAFSGGGIAVSVQLTYGTDTDPTYSDAFVVTGISGTFSDSNIGIAGVPILGLVATTFATPEPDNLLAPANFSRFAVATGAPPISNGFLSYDNLLWPAGAPPTASDYAGAGGALDIYGLLFRIGNGRVVNLWSNGIFGPPGSEPIPYGAAVATSDEMLDYQFGTLAAVPEPTTMALLLAGLGWLGFARRRPT